MLIEPGKGKLLKIYIGEMQKHGFKTLYHAIVLKLKELGIAGVTVYRGIEGYGAANLIRTAHILDLSVDLPIVIEIVDTADKIEEILPVIAQMVQKGLIITADVEVIKHA